MWNDPIVEEIHKFRQAQAEKFNYDLQAMFDYLKEQEKKNRRRVVSLPIKRQSLTPAVPEARRKKRVGRRTQPILFSEV